MSKIKYTWELMHGDADHTDNEEMILTDEKEIAFFDYLRELWKKGNDGDEREWSLNNFSNEEHDKLISLYCATEWCEEDDEDIQEGLMDFLREIDYLKNDVTCPDYYAEVVTFDRKIMNEYTVETIVADNAILLKIDSKTITNLFDKRSEDGSKVKYDAKYLDAIAKSIVESIEDNEILEDAIEDAINE